ncbi:hypothetical protein [Streptomyces sp. NPDC089915]|uniref:hypothetical protein n=1 Tax=Streptomyces sp. NPDC089915 TaxID=3155186 RepID=UPI0034377AAC
MSHHLASGDEVSWARVAAGTAVAFALSWTVSRISRPWWHVVAATGLAQLVLHRVLSDGQPVCHGPAGGHEGAPQAVRLALRGVWAMTAAHCAAACLLALLMYRADRALGRLPETVGRWAQRAVAAAAAAFGSLRPPWSGPRPPAGPTPHGGPATAPGTAAALSHVVVRRGPPAGWAGDVSPILAGRSLAW